MCKERLAPSPCWNLKWPHNLFWEKLKLDIGKIHMTKEALEIGNCCCSIRKPWTVEEIEAVWGLPKAEISAMVAHAARRVLGGNGDKDRKPRMSPG